MYSAGRIILLLSERPTADNANPTAKWLRFQYCWDYNAESEKQLDYMSELGA
jgi:hypothetical protein